MDVLRQTCLKNQSISRRSYIRNVFYEVIHSVSPNQSSVILQSIWKDIMRDVKMSPIYTQEGICFTLNSINSREIYTDE